MELKHPDSTYEYIQGRKYFPSPQFKNWKLYNRFRTIKTLQSKQGHYVNNYNKYNSEIDIRLGKFVFE